MDPTNPFSALTLIAAPAVLTNASSVLSMGTSNRLIRSADRAREISAWLEQDAEHDSPLTKSRIEELKTLQRRLPLLIRALQSFYLAVGGFAAAALISLMGAVLTPILNGWSGKVLEIVALLVGAVAVIALSRGALLLVAETRLVMVTLGARMAHVQINIANHIEQIDNTPANNSSDKST